MHDLDRTMMELEDELEYGSEYEDDDEFGMGEYEYEDDFGYEFEDDDFGEYEFDGPSSVLSDEEELELASDLLSATSDEELEMFLGKVFKKVRNKARGLIRRGKRALKSGVGRRLKGIVRKVARKALPVAGGAIGGVFGGPAGAAVGSRVAGGAGQLLGLELEGLSPEDQEFEAAKRVVRLAADATADAIKGSQTPARPANIVRTAVTKAARKHAPGLLRSGGPGGAAGGRWIRRGNKIVLIGV